MITIAAAFARTVSRYDKPSFQPVPRPKFATRMWRHSCLKLHLVCCPKPWQAAFRFEDRRPRRRSSRRLRGVLARVPALADHPFTGAARRWDANSSTSLFLIESSFCRCMAMAISHDPPQKIGWLPRPLTTDFWPWANRFVYWLKEPVGWFVLATAVSIMIMIGLYLAPIG